MSAAIIDRMAFRLIMIGSHWLLPSFLRLIFDPNSPVAPVSSIYSFNVSTSHSVKVGLMILRLDCDCIPCDLRHKHVSYPTLLCFLNLISANGSHEVTYLLFSVSASVFDGLPIWHCWTNCNSLFVEKTCFYAQNPVMDIYIRYLLVIPDDSEMKYWRRLVGH